MEVKPGYKQTEVGIIPDEWDVAPLSREVEGLDAGVSVNSLTDGLGSYEHDPAVLKTSAIVGGQFLPQESKVIAARDISRAKLNPRIDSIIISRMNTPDLVGECGYVFADFPNLFLPDRLWMTRNRSGSDVCVHWLSYLLCSKAYKTRIKGFATGTSGSMKNIAKDGLLSMLIPYPTSCEQRAIAGALSDVDGLLGALERLIAKKRDLKAATMQQLLTGKTRRLPGFSGEWLTKQVGHAGRCFRGVSYQGESDLFTHDSNDTKRLLRANNVDNAVVVTDDIQFVNAARVSPQQILRPNDILICTANGSKALVGKAGLFAVNDGYAYTFGAFMGCFRTDATAANPHFVFYLLQTAQYRNYISNLLAGSSINNLRPSSLESLEFGFPAIAEQTAIAEVLMDMDAELAALEQRLEKTRALKQAMMQELLTGRTRLV